MLRDAAPRRPVLGEDEQPRHGINLPAERSSESGCESRLAVEVRERRLEVRDGGLDLDDQQRPDLGVKGEDVDRAAFPVLAEGHLCPGDPAFSRQQPEDALDDRGMPLVAQPVQRFALPVHPHRQPRSERRGHSQQDGKGDSLCVAALDGRDRRARDPYLIGQTLLCPASVLTEEPKVQAGAGKVHRRECGDLDSPTTWPGIIGACVRSKEPGECGRWSGSACVRLSLGTDPPQESTPRPA